MKKNKIEIGQKVFVISKDCKIEEKEVLAIINSGDKIGYTLDKNSCGGYLEDDVFTTNGMAEAHLQSFLDGLKFSVGELVVFEYKDYSNNKRSIGRISRIIHSDFQYEVMGSYKEFDSICEEQILLKIKNKFIENYGNLQELSEKFKEMEKEISNVASLIHKEHDRLETELETSIKKNYSIFNWSRKKPLFKDRFSYVREYY